MPTYAILGATGNVGSHLLKVLSDRQDIKIRAFVRSKSKLQSQIPDLINQITVYEGSIDNISVLAQSLRDTDAAFLTVAASTNIPGCSIAQDQARNVVAALTQNRDSHEGCKTPVLVVLSSAETVEEMVDLSWPLSSIMYCANFFVYEDLKAAEAYFLKPENRWIQSTFCKPGGISHDKQFGHVLTSTGKCQTFVSFLDVAAGMVQMADEGGKWVGKGVTVQSPGKAKPEYANLPLLGKGFVVYLFPSLYSWVY